MKSSKLLASALTLLSITTALDAKHNRQIVAFGNSETDTGNTPFGELSIPIMGLSINHYANPESPYANGAQWISQLGNLWSTPVEASSHGGLNYAMVGAQTSADSAFVPLANVVGPPPFFPPNVQINIASGTIYIPSMRTQINQFLTQRKEVSKKAIVFLRGNFNDLFFDAFAPPVDPVADGLLAASDTVTNLKTLKKAGYRNQVTFNQIVNFPNAVVSGLGSTAFTNAFNSAVLSGLKKASLHPVVIDINSLVVDLLSNLPFYGFTGAGGNPVVGPSFGPGLGPMATLTGPNDTFFWFDGLHASALVDTYLAQYVYSLLEAPECWGHLAVQPFALMRGQNAVLRQELYPIVDICEGQLYPFISGSYIPDETAPFPYGKTPDTSGWNGTLGLAYRALPHWTVGVAGSYNQNFFEDRHKIGKCDFNLDSWVVSLLSGMHIDRGYLNGIFNAGFMKFDDITRHFSIGPKNWKARGDTHGMQYDVMVEGGWYFFRNDDCQMGPIATVEYQYAGINGYREHSASYNNLQFKHQHVNSFVTGLGLEALIWSPWKDSCAPGFSMKMFLAANEDWVRGKRHVQFRQQSLGGGAPWGNWPIYQERTFFGSGGISFTNTFKNGAIFTFGYRGNWGQNHMQEHNITASITFPVTKAKPICEEKPSLFQRLRGGGSK